MSDNTKTMEKKRVVIIGSSPLPIENATKNGAFGARTWHFAQAAKNANCDVMIIGYRIPNSYNEVLPEINFKNIDGMNYYSIEGHIFENNKWLEQKILEFKPDCIVAVNTYPSSIISDLNLEVPFWADLNGSVMAEAQVKAYVHDDDLFLHHYFNMESKALSAADIFSVVSEAQGFSLIGELGIWGRLNKNTMGYRFVRVIPNTSNNTKFKHTKNVLRGKYAKDSDFVILYSGGYNTWTDVDTLFLGLEKAMAKNPNLVFVSTGGKIEGHDEVTYPHFEDLVNSSKFKKRFHLCGWVPNEELHNYYLEANLGINSDKFCYEALLGSRTRILDWLRVPLTFISTPLSEVTNYLIQNKLAYGFKQGDSDDLAEKLAKISTNGREIENMKTRIEKIFDEEFNSEYIFREFVDWIKNPQYSPDRGKVVNLISKPKSNIQTGTTNSVSLLSRFAISMWPNVYSFLKFLHLDKHEEKVKLFGIKLFVPDKPLVYRADFLEVNIPEMIQDKKFLVPVVVKNIGKTTWKNHKESFNAVNLSYIWKNKQGDIVLKPEERTPLPKSIKPGQKIKLQAMITSPTNPGEYVLEIDLVKENEFWFSNVNSKPYSHIVNVKKKINPTKMDMPKVSVVVVSFNSEKFISKCVDSLLKSNYPNFEVIVVDNDSKDNSLKELSKFKDKIKLIQSKENLGFAGGNNLGIQNANGEIIALINPDAFVTEDAILELILPFLNDDKIMITGSKILYPDTAKIQSAGGLIYKNGLSQHIGYGNLDNSQYDFERSVDYVTGAALAIRRKLLEITGLFDPTYNPAYYEETEKCFLARKLHYKVVYAPKSIVYHHESTTHGVGSRPYLKLYHTNRFKFVYRNFNFRSFFLDFIPYELGWFFYFCPNSQKGLVLKAHLQVLFSPKIRRKEIQPIEKLHKNKLEYVLK